MEESTFITSLRNQGVPLPIVLRATKALDDLAYAYMQPHAHARLFIASARAAARAAVAKAVGAAHQEPPAHTTADRQYDSDFHIDDNMHITYVGGSGKQHTRLETHNIINRLLTDFIQKNPDLKQCLDTKDNDK